MSLSPPSLTRARSSSTVGPFTQPRSRTVSSTKLPPPPSPASSTDTLIDPQTPTTSSGGMIDALVQIASKLIPFHDALSTGPLPNQSSPYPSAIEEKNRQLDILTLRGNDKSVRWGDDVKVDAPASNHVQFGARRTRPPPRRPKRTLSPFSSLFIKPPTATDGELPPPAISSPRSSFSFSRFSPIPIPPISLHLPSSPSTEPNLITPLLFVCSLFFITFIPTLVLLYTLPIPSLKSIPRTIADIKLVAHQLQIYSDSSLKGRTHILAVLAVTSVWKNAWSVPGSVLLNVLAGALMNPILATLLQTLLTAIGSICASLLSKPLGPIIEKVFPKALSLTRSAFEPTPTSSPDLTPSNIIPVDSELDEDEEAEESQTLLMTQKEDVLEAQATSPTPVWVRLTILRLIGVVPWSALNLACGICSVPLWDCALGAFIGVLPWTAVTCQIGDLLQTVAVKTTNAAASADPIAPAETLSALLSSPSIIIKLVILSLVSLGPVLMRDKLSRIVTRRRPRVSREIVDLASPAFDEKTRTA